MNAPVVVNSHVEPAGSSVHTTPTFCFDTQFYWIRNSVFFNIMQVTSPFFLTGDTNVHEAEQYKVQYHKPMSSLDLLRWEFGGDKRDK